MYYQRGGDFAWLVLYYIWLVSNIGKVGSLGALTMQSNSPVNDFMEVPYFGAHLYTHQ